MLKFYILDLFVILDFRSFRGSDLGFLIFDCGVMSAINKYILQLCELMCVRWGGPSSYIRFPTVIKQHNMLLPM